MISLISGATTTIVLWIFGIVGFYMLMIGLEALGVFGDSVTISF